MSIQTTYPATNKVVKSFEEMTEVALDATIAHADYLFQGQKIRVSVENYRNLAFKNL